MKNQLYLHEAIVIALINIDKVTYTASFEQIANYIEGRGLYLERKGNISLSKQVELRSIQSKKRYAYLFKDLGNGSIKLNM